MKIRNFAFFGVMASIFAVSGANADALTTKKVATVGYVNAHSADAVYNSEAAYANGTIGKAIQALDSATDTALDGKANVDLGNIDSTGKGVIDTRAVNKINDAAGTTANTSLSASNGVLTVNVDDSTVGRNASGQLEVKSGVFDAAGAAATAEQNAKDYADGLSSNYATAAQGTTADDTAMLVGTLPSGIQSTTVVGYIDEAVANANTTALGGLDGQNAISSTGVSAGNAADQTKVGMPVVSVVQSDGNVTSTLGTITNTGVATGANIEYAKMDGEGLAGIDVADNDCTSANPCVLTYIGNNTYKWTNMGVDETPTAAAQGN